MEGRTSHPVIKGYLGGAWSFTVFQDDSNSAGGAAVVLDVRPELQHLITDDEEGHSKPYPSDVPYVIPQAAFDRLVVYDRMESEEATPVFALDVLDDESDRTDPIDQRKSWLRIRRHRHRSGEVEINAILRNLVGRSHMNNPVSSSTFYGFTHVRIELRVRAQERVEVEDAWVGQWHKRDVWVSELIGEEMRLHRGTRYNGLLRALGFHRSSFRSLSSHAFWRDESWRDPQRTEQGVSRPSTIKVLGFRTRFRLRRREDNRIALAWPAGLVLDVPPWLGSNTKTFELVQRRPRRLSGAWSYAAEGSERDDWVVHFDGIPGYNVYDFWNQHIVRPHLRSLHRVKAGRSWSALPEFDGYDRPPSREAWTVKPQWSLVFVVTDRVASSKIKWTEWSIGRRRLTESVCNQPSTDGLLVVQPAVQPMHHGEGTAISAVAHGLRNHDGASFRWRGTPENPFPGQEDRPFDELRANIQFAFRRSSAKADPEGAAATSHFARLGALDLELLETEPEAAPGDSKGGDTRPTVTPRTQFRVDLREVYPGGPPEVAVLDFEVEIRVGRALPGGQDPPEEQEFVQQFEQLRSRSTDSDVDRLVATSFRREPPLVIRLAESEDGAQPPLFLRITEQTKEDRSHTLRVRLERDRFSETPDARGGAAATRILVLDRQPLTVALLDVPVLGASLGRDGVLEVGNWSNADAQGAFWELPDSDTAALFLPPQGMGEAAERSPTRGDATGPRPAHDIAEAEANDTTGGETKPLTDGEIADARFTPPATLSLSPRFVQQAFSEASWNLRRLFGSPSQRIPGVRLDGFEMELLYGLWAAFEDLGRADQPLRLAEVNALMGRYPGLLLRDLPWQGTRLGAATLDDLVLSPAGLRQAYDAFRERWALIQQALMTRLGVLDVVRGLRQDRPTIEAGLTFRLRPTAALRWPVPHLEPDALQDGAIPLSIAKPIAEYSPTEDYGLAGGVGWGIESRNVYRAVWRDPKASSSLLIGPRFSPLGGWGFQKAGFDRDLTTIYADAAMGRTFHYSVERLGRIGVCWNLAKHVVVYERTVVPAPALQDDQDKHVGRPVLRKVREYVKILEPVRAVSEEGGPIAAGCVRATDFGDIDEIDVKSYWGSDVDARDGTPLGWQVPLWSSDADPRFYPKPAIALRLAGVHEGEGEAPDAVYTIDEPEKLRFFTLTELGADPDPHQWEAVETVDYPDLPPPAALELDALDERIPDAELPDAPETEEGFEVFTWAVTTAGNPANIVANRTKEPMAALIRNVTMARARPLSWDPKEPKGPDQVLEAGLRAVREKVEKTLQNVASLVPESDRRVDASFLSSAKSAVADIKREFNGAGLFSDLEQALEGKLGVQNLDSLFNAEKICGDLKGEMLATIDRGVQEAKARIDQRDSQLVRALLNLSAQEARAKDRVRAAIRAVFDPALGTIERLGTALEPVRRVLRLARGLPETLDEEIEGLLGGIEQRLLEESTRWETIGKQAVKESLRRSRDRIRRAVVALENKLAGEVHEHLHDIGVQVRGGVRSFLGLAASGANTTLDELTERAERAIDDAALPSDALESLRALPGVIVAEILQAVKFSEIREKIDDVGKLLGSLDEQLDGVLAVDEHAKKLEALLDGLGDDIDFVSAVLEKRRSVKEALFKEIDGARDVVVQRADKVASEVCSKFTQGASEVANRLKELIGSSKFLDELEELFDGAAQAGKTFKQLRDELGKYHNAVGNEIRPVVKRVRDAARGLSQGNIWQRADSGLRLLRAFGDAPKVSQLGFNRDRIAYYFDELKEQVATTPVGALLDRGGKQLRSLGIRLPTKEILDRLRPDLLENFDLSSILPDFAGINLSSLFPDLKMPRLGNDRIKVKHGVDKQRMRAWVQADVDLPLTKRATVFDIGPVVLRLNRAQFTATIRIEAGAGGAPERMARGSIKGDWELQLLDLHVLTFRETSCRFAEDGKVRFDISPDNVDLKGALKPIADAIRSFKLGGDDGFVLKFVEHNGIPVGVSASIDLPLPDVSFGAFGFTGIQFGAGFELVALPEFQLAVRLNLSRKIKPFTVTIFILGGGGWLESRTTYLPLTRAYQTSLTIGIVAGAQLVFAFGPIRGGVYLHFGVSAEFRADSRQAGTELRIGIMLLARGEADVLGIISVSIHLLLEAEYTNSGRIVGRGSVSISVKICWCFTLRVRADVEYVLKEGSRPGRSESDSFEALTAKENEDDSLEARVGDYLDMYERVE